MAAGGVSSRDGAKVPVAIPHASGVRARTAATTGAADLSGPFGTGRRVRSGQRITLLLYSLSGGEWTTRVVTLPVQ